MFPNRHLFFALPLLLAACPEEVPKDDTDAPTDAADDTDTTTPDTDGTADDTPDRLRALATGDERARREAQYWLSASIHHQGTLYSATPPAIPFLVRLACDRSIAERAWIVRFLADLAVSRPNDFVWAGFDLRAELPQGDFRVVAGAGGLVDDGFAVGV